MLIKWYKTAAISLYFNFYLSNEIAFSWGDYDVADAILATKFLIEDGRVNETAIVLSGFFFSAYTILEALKSGTFFQGGRQF